MVPRQPKDSCSASVRNQRTVYNNLQRTIMRFETDKNQLGKRVRRQRMFIKMVKKRRGMQPLSITSLATRTRLKSTTN